MTKVVRYTYKMCADVEFDVKSQKVKQHQKKISLFVSVELGESGEISHLPEGETQPSPPLHHTETHRPKYNS